MDCLFCKILNDDIPSTKVFENENVLGFVDINPMAKKHFLFIHKEHTTDINDLTLTQPNHLVEVFNAIYSFTTDSGLSKTGFRVVTNQGREGGQTVFHTHFHVLGGEQLRGFGS
jgi:histidine triad (HIT) family protein